MAGQKVGIVRISYDKNVPAGAAVVMGHTDDEVAEKDAEIEHLRETIRQMEGMA